MKNTKFLRKRMCTVLFIVCCLCTSMPMVAQITLSMKNATLGQVIQAVKKQTDYQFFYEDNLARIPVGNVNLKDVTLKAVLDNVLENKNIDYSIEEKIVYLSNKNVIKTDGKQNGKGKTITGQVSDASGEPLIGVSVAVKGTQTGVITDLDGNYTLLVPSSESEIVFSYVGYATQTLAVTDNTKIDLILRENVNEIDEVVVTALGIKRDKKYLGYSIQELKGDAMNQTGNASVTGALQGKVAGIQMNVSPTGLNGSTKITIRGNSSLTDNNQPLWIVDGIPFGDESNSSVSLFGGVDRGGTSVDINPEDIETLSVLKGPNAAALYGSRAGNGVILITTKKGTRNNGFGVNYSSTYTWTSVAETLDMQTRYGQGLNGVYNSGTPFSYGEELNGQQVPAWWKNNDGLTLPYSYQGNRMKDYFNTGFSHNQNVSIGNVTEDSHYRVSIGYLDSKGVFDGEGLNKYNIDLNSGKKINKYLHMDSKISLSKTTANNRPYIGKYGEMFQLVYLPNNIGLNDLNRYHTRVEANKYGKDFDVHQNWLGPTQDIMNPYWVHNQRTNLDERWRAFGYHSMQINITDWLSAVGKFSLDYYRTKIEETNKGLGGSPEDMELNDEFVKMENNFSEMNYEFMIRGNNTIGEKIRVDYSVGGSRMDKTIEGLSANARNMKDKGHWYLNSAGTNIGGGISSYANQSFINKRTNSLFGTFQVAYNDYLSFDMSARNDWSSTLPSPHSYFYPSFNLSLIGTEFMHKMGVHVPSWLTYGKLRASYAKAGKDTDAYALANYWIYRQTNTGPEAGKYNIYLGDDLKPEMNTSFEAGLEMKFLNNRVGFDFTYYHSMTNNQIMSIPIDKSTTFDGSRVNAGAIRNTGVEFAFYSTPVRTKEFEFGFDFNLSHNKTVVKEMHDLNKYVDFGDGVDKFFFTVGAVEGGKLGDIYAKRIYKRDENGNMIISKLTGLPQVKGSGKREDMIIGNIQPDLMMSVLPRFSYKNIHLTAMFDMKFGGDIVSVTEAIATHYGTAKRTENRNETVVLPGVYDDGTPNTKAIKYEDFYRFVGNTGTDAGMAEEFVYDASYVCFRELSLGYSFGRSLLKKTPFTSLKLSFVARNLGYLMKNTPGTNPEGGFDISMYSQAFDFLTTPSTRTLGFSVNIGF